MMRFNIKFGKMFTVLTAVAVSVLCIPGNLRAAEREVTLKESTVLDDDYLRVGNVFGNAGDVSAHPLAPLPDAGKPLVLNINDMTRIAKAFGFKWIPSAETPATISFTRNASRVGPEDLKKILKDSELSQSVGSDYDISFEKSMKPFDVKGRNIASFSAQNISYNPVTERFTADIYAFDDKTDVIGMQSVSGNAFKMITVPVLRNRTMGNAMINENDIAELRIRQSELGDAVIMSPDRVIGMATRRALPSMTPLNSGDLMMPRIVKKNDIITISMSRGPLSLTAKGRALSDGAKGDMISILNLSGKKVVEAVVVSAGNAAIPATDTY